MAALTAPLRGAPVDAVAWAAAYLATARSMIGSAKLSLPDDLEERLALEYKLLVAVSDGAVDVHTLILKGFGATRNDSIVQTFNEQFFRPFAREVGYRLDDLAQDLGDDSRVPVERLLVVLNAGGTVNIDERDQRGATVSTSHTTVSGNTNSNVAVGGSSIVGSPISVSTSTELARALRELPGADAGLTGPTRVTVREAAEVLAAAAERSEAVPADRVALARAAVTVAEASPSMAERLKQIAVGAAGNLAASAVIAAIKFALGIV